MNDITEEGRCSPRERNFADARWAATPQSESWDRCAYGPGNDSKGWAGRHPGPCSGPLVNIPADPPRLLVGYSICQGHRAFHASLPTVEDIERLMRGEGSS